MAPACEPDHRGLASDSVAPGLAGTRSAKDTRRRQDATRRVRNRDAKAFSETNPLGQVHGLVTKSRLGFAMIGTHMRSSLQYRGYSVMKRSVAPLALAIGLALSVAACTDPYDPGQRAAGGGLLGAGAGAAIGGLAGGGRGALLGGLAGGALGAVGGAATTPQPPPPRYQPEYPPPPPPYKPY
jgi:hypothetical protein